MKKESDFVGNGIRSIILIINKLLYYFLHLGFTNIKFAIFPQLEPKVINRAFKEFPFRENAVVPFESKENKGR
jgi:hypothetical protein